MNGPIQVLIVDNESAFLQKARTSLESAGGITVVGTATDEQEAVMIVRETHPDVVLLDIDLERIAPILTLSRHSKIIVTHALGQERLVLEALKKGALGHLIREKVHPDEIVAAVRAVYRGEAVISSGIAGRILDQVFRK